MVSLLALTRLALDRVAGSGLDGGAVECIEGENNGQEMRCYEEGEEEEYRLVGKASMWWSRAP